MADMKELREKIDVIDDQLQRLFEERMKVSEQIGVYKASCGMPVFDEKRESEKIAELKARASSEENAEGIEALYRTIFEVSRKKQETLRG